MSVVEDSKGSNIPKETITTTPQTPKNLTKRTLFPSKILAKMSPLKSLPKRKPFQGILRKRIPKLKLNQKRALKREKTPKRKKRENMLDLTLTRMLLLER